MSGRFGRGEVIISKVTSNRATSFTAAPWWTQNWYLRLLIRSRFSYNTWSHTTSFATTFRPANYVDFFVWEYDGWMFIRRHIKPELDNIFGVLDRDIMTEVLVRASAENADEVARFNQRIIQVNDLHPLRQQSFIAVEDNRKNFICRHAKPELKLLVCEMETAGYQPWADARLDG
ncbi:hypothetical protein KCU95_g8169, partial [Aureobasidium melanogenum]